MQLLKTFTAFVSSFAVGTLAARTHSKAVADKSRSERSAKKSSKTAVKKASAPKKTSKAAIVKKATKEMMPMDNYAKEIDAIMVRDGKEEKVPVRGIQNAPDTLTLGKATLAQLKATRTVLMSKDGAKLMDRASGLVGAFNFNWKKSDSAKTVRNVSKELGCIAKKDVQAQVRKNKDVNEQLIKNANYECRNYILKLHLVVCLSPKLIPPFFLFLARK